MNLPRSESTVKGLKPAFKPEEMTRKRFRHTFDLVLFVNELPARWRLGAERASSLILGFKQDNEQIRMSEAQI